MQSIVKSYLTFTIVTIFFMTLMGLAAPYKPYLDIINDFRIHILAIILVSLIIAELSSVQYATFWATILLIINAFFLIPGFYFIENTAPTNSPGLRVLSFNMDKSIRELDKITAMLKEENADLISVEGLNGSEDSLFHQLGTLYPYQAVCTERHLCQMALLSKKELKDVMFTNSAKGIPSTISASIIINNRKVSVIGVSLSSPITNNNQREEIDYLVDRINVTYGPIIMLGTFNATPWSWGLSNIQMRTGLLRHRTLGANWPAKTWPFFPQLLIEHIMTRGSFRTENAYTGKKTESNHFPIVVDLAGP